MSPGPARTVENAVCAFCGCTCDDITLRVQDGRIVEAERACEPGREWFAAVSDGAGPDACVEGRPAAADEAIDAAARLLAGARAPLLYGLVEASGEAQAAAVELADLLGATLDTAASQAHGPWLTALQRRGVRSATLTEVKNRADLVVLWEVLPEETHPRFFERFVRPDGLYVKGQRIVIAVGEEGAKSSAEANRAFPLPKGRSFEALWALRCILQGGRLARDAESAIGIPVDDLAEWAQSLTECRYGVWIYDAERAVGPALAEAVFALVEALGEKTAFSALGLRGRGNPLGAENALAARTGYPFALDFGRGYPRYGPGEFSAARVLSRGEADAVLLVGAAAADALPEDARRARERTPTVVVDYRDSERARAARAFVRTAPYGVAAPATVTRMDGVTLRARRAVESPRPSDGEVLRRLIDRVAALRASGDT